MSQTTNGTPMMMTLKETGRIIGMSQPTLRKWIRAGYLHTVPSSPTSRRQKITRREIARFIERIAN